MLLYCILVVREQLAQGLESAINELFKTKKHSTPSRSTDLSPEHKTEKYITVCFVTHQATLYCFASSCGAPGVTLGCGITMPWWFILWITCRFLLLEHVNRLSSQLLILQYFKRWLYIYALFIAQIYHDILFTAVLRVFIIYYVAILIYIISSKLFCNAVCWFQLLDLVFYRVDSTVLWAETADI